MMNSKSGEKAGGTGKQEKQTDGQRETACRRNADDYYQRPEKGKAGNRGPAGSAERRVSSYSLPFWELAVEGHPEVKKWLSKLGWKLEK